MRGSGIPRPRPPTAAGTPTAPGRVRVNPGGGEPRLCSRWLHAMGSRRPLERPVAASTRSRSPRDSTFRHRAVVVVRAALRGVSPRTNWAACAAVVVERRPVRSNPGQPDRGLRAQAQKTATVPQHRRSRSAGSCGHIGPECAAGGRRPFQAFRAPSARDDPSAPDRIGDRPGTRISIQPRPDRRLGRCRPRALNKWTISEDIRQPRKGEGAV